MFYFKTKRQSFIVVLDVKMDQTLRCVLGFFLLNLIPHGLAQGNRPRVTTTSNWPETFWTETLTLRCEIEGGGDSEWTFGWRRDRTSSSDKYTTDNKYIISQATDSDNGDYECIGRRGSPNSTFTPWSEPFKLTVTPRTPKAELRADSTSIPAGGAVTLTCDVNPPSSGWTYILYRGDHPGTQDDGKNFNGRFSVSKGGVYRCRGVRGEPVYYTYYSDSVTINIILSNRAVVTLQPHWTEIHSGEKITLRCEIEGGDDSEWEYEWETTSSDRSVKQSESFEISATSYSEGEYKCKGKHKTEVLSSTPWSTPITLTVSEQKPKAELKADVTDIPVGGYVTLTCDVSSSSGWQYYFWYRADKSSNPSSINEFSSAGQKRVSKEGLYWCRGARGNPVYYTEDSNTIQLKENTRRPKAELRADRTSIPAGGAVTLTCDVNPPSSGWTYILFRGDHPGTQDDGKNFNGRISVSKGGVYWCRGERGEPVYYTEYSDSVTINIILSDRAVVTLQPHWTEIHSGEKITLRCEIEGGDDSEWEYEWETTSSDRSVRQSESFEITATSYSEGEYKCKGKHKTEVLSSTPWSTPITLTVSEQKPKPELKADVTDIPVGGYVTLTCDVSSSSGWQYYFWYRADKSSNPSSINEFSSAGQKRVSKEGLYWCRGARGNPVYYTEDSNTIQLKENSSPQPVLTVSPLWLSPGDSVTLNCEVKHPSAGWRFYWYEAIPKLSDNSYNYQLLSGSRNGTEKYSFIVNGQTHTAGYVCRAGRGEMNTPYSEPKFVWSGDLPSSASLTVSPERVQHFTSDSVSLECKGNSTQWRVKFQEDSFLADCSLWDKMTGSTCTIDRHISRNNVYWCESGSGEFSNAVNITKQKSDIILVSPVHPVTEGSSVSLSCRLRSSDIVSNVFFYQNNKLIQNDTRKELNISAVSKSDEGFYKCQTSGRESSQSWMSVTVVSRLGNPSYLLILMIVGLICGVVLIILLLLLYRCRQSKDSCLIRRSIQSESTNQDSATNPAAQHHEYSPPLQGDACHYESIKGPEDTAHDANHSQSQDVTYSLIELKNIGKKGKKPEPDSTIYSDVRLETEDTSVLYSQVSCHNPGKAKKNKGKPTPAITEESVYSEVKPDQ
ncbi:Fc receptor-like protein 5 isoform X3 [Labrus bergylta]|uniref:Fc receptor-like protein 5 isoform X3 n=1 Tax=Labrus bergylta TaxID=56723 RepID=UPI003313A581